MTPDQTLFDIPERRAYDPPLRRVPVRAHERAVVPRARKTDPETSVRAAADAKPHAQRDRDRVLACLREHGELTDFEIASKLDGQQTSLGKRRGELRDAGLVEFAGYTRPSPSGSAARVWKLA